MSTKFKLSLTQEMINKEIEAKAKFERKLQTQDLLIASAEAQASILIKTEAYMKETAEELRKFEIITKTLLFIIVFIFTLC